MQELEPFYNWRHLYIANEDPRSPFYGREYSEIYFTHTIYNHYIHPQWDEIGSSTLYIKILYCDYEKSFAVIEFIGEWNDLLYNDIMFLKRDIIEILIAEGIYKFILIGENIMNFHHAEDDYYQEWFDEIEDGWIVGLNFRQHVIEEFSRCNIDYYILFGGEFNEMNWRTANPLHLYQKIESIMNKRLPV
ncbi:MAG: hypothetical protein JEZ03_12425 [Bacteroidales bacterium]|nr:hypothetical protein [Bacteroidales bacterium]